MKSLLLVLFAASTVHALPSINDTRIEKLPTQKIKVGTQSVTVEIADDEDERERGLMYRKSMPANEGMLFVFQSAQPMAFWMKNTLIPLSIGYFGADGKLLNTYEMSAGVIGEQHPKTYESKGAAMYALEMNKGWFSKHKIKEGAVLTLPDKGPVK